MDYIPNFTDTNLLQRLSDRAKVVCQKNGIDIHCIPFWKWMIDKLEPWEA